MAIRYEIHGAIVMITIDRAEAMNALDQEHNDQLTEAFAGYEADPALRVAVLTGAGEKSFCAGADLGRLLARIPRRGSRRRGTAVGLRGDHGRGARRQAQDCRRQRACSRRGPGDGAGV